MQYLTCIHVYNIMLAAQSPTFNESPSWRMWLQPVKTGQVLTTAQTRMGIRMTTLLTGERYIIISLFPVVLRSVANEVGQSR